MFNQKHVILFVILFIYTFLQKSSTSDRLIDKIVTNVTEQNFTNSIKVVAFYNIFAQGKYYKPIVADQIKTLKETGLLDRIDKLYYVTIGNEARKFTLDVKQAEKIRSFLVGNELETLTAIHLFCRNHSDAKIVYFHNKGSYHHSELNEQWRKVMDCIVLSQNCLDVMDQYDTCGLRLSAFPHPHYSGNFLWATCAHINKLRSPRKMSKEIDHWHETYINHDHMNYLRKGYGCLESVIGAGRYFAETWMTSLPEFRPADCLSLSIDDKFTFRRDGGYELPISKITPYCPNLYKSNRHYRNSNHNNQNSNSNNNVIINYGMKCTNASMLVSRFPMHTYVHHNCSALEVYIDRSCMWYNKYPETLALMRQNYNISIDDKKNRICNKSNISKSTIS